MTARSWVFGRTVTGNFSPQKCIVISTCSLAVDARNISLVATTSHISIICLALSSIPMEGYYHISLELPNSGDFYLLVSTIMFPHGSETSRTLSF